MNASKVTWISTNCEKQWEGRDAFVHSADDANLAFNGVEHQTVQGFGGCFNELGWIALSYLKEEDRAWVLDELFDPQASCRFNFCRLPIGANDYAEHWYSHNECEGDYAMEHFSIARDTKYLLPYIKEGLKRNPEMKLFASPWSAPTWMKRPKAYNYGTMIWEEKVLRAYALYFLKFVQAYQAEGVTIHQIHVQNEPVADQKFPSCVWTGAELRDFIRDYFGPLFELHAPSTEVWLGTLNGPNISDYVGTDYDYYAGLVLKDVQARKYIKGVGYQWGGKNAIQRTHEAWPELPLMQTENECGDGDNSWAYARYVFNLLKHYFSNGVENYIYWNMALLPEGMSTWGWKQNALITIDPVSRTAVLNPEFYLMKHFSHFIEKDAVRLGLAGAWAAHALAFRNPGGNVLLVICNPYRDRQKMVLGKGAESLTFELNPESFNTITFE